MVHQTREGRPRRPSPRPGAAAAELAILLPFLGLLFVLAADYCRVFYCAQVVQSCATSGALYASETAKRNPSTTTDDTDAATQAAVAAGASLNPPLTASAVTVAVANGVATVTVTYPFQTVTSYPGVGGTVTITRTVSMNMAPQVGQ